MLHVCVQDKHFSKYYSGKLHCRFMLCWFYTLSYTIRLSLTSFIIWTQLVFLVNYPFKVKETNLILDCVGQQEIIRRRESYLFKFRNVSPQVLSHCIVNRTDIGFTLPNIRNCPWSDKKTVTEKVFIFNWPVPIRRQWRDLQRDLTHIDHFYRFEILIIFHYQQKE